MALLRPEQMVQQRQPAAVLARLADARLLAVLRTQSAEEAAWLAERYIEAGISALEITYTTPLATGLIQALRSAYPHVLVGAGTVRDLSTARQAVNAGAQFLVSPFLDESIVQFGLSNQCLAVPGVMTPTEMHLALKAGALALKLYPVRQLGGASFVQAVRNPLPDVALIPTGGVQLEDVQPLLRAGALAVGVSSPLVPSLEVVRRRNKVAVWDRVQQFLDAAHC
jgi:2-dehydro-3-deoxyphosphogluconate aldolase/(4S)-4-hydroxy-2-oxoglutarate aldolase